MTQSAARRVLPDVRMLLPSGIDSVRGRFAPPRRGALGALPLRNTHRRQVEIVARPGIAVSAHAPNGVETIGVDMETVIDERGVDMGRQHFAENDLARCADLKRHMLPAFEG